MGVVYRVRRTDLQRDYALKVILPGRDASDEAVARFRREAQAAARLAGHPGIVGVHDIGEADGRVYFAMDLVEGRSLDCLIDEGELTPPRVARILEGAARAVHAAHAHGILHRDLKPANIMVSAADEPRITDFGLAKAQDGGPGGSRLTQFGTVLGTPAYMSPEQARGGALDPRADVWSLGATLFEALAGRPPFEGDSVFAILSQLERRDPPLLRRLDPRVPRELETITQKCLEKDPARRYPSAEALADDLARWQRGDSILAHPPGIATRLRKAAGRHRALVAGVAGAALAVAVLLPRALLERGRRTDAEGRLAAEQALAVDQLRKRTRFALEGALELRRAGHVAAMATFGREAEAACREAMALLPGSPEPHARLGRMYRALLRDDAALQQQAQALAKDPGHAPARYERVVLQARRLFARAQVLMQDARRRLGQGTAGEAPRSIPWQALLQADPTAAALLAAIEADLRALETPGTDLPAGELECARGLLAWLTGNLAAARTHLTRAVADAPLLEEAYETLATLAWAEDRPDEVIRWLTEGLARDAGYLPHREERGRAHAALAVARAEAGQAPAASFAAALADFDDVIAKDPDRASAWATRGGARLTRGVRGAELGADPVADYEAAVADLDQALARAPDHVEAWEWRALARANWGHHRRDRGQDPSALYTAAIDDYGQALARAPDRAKTWMLRAVLRDGLADHLAAQGRDGTPVWTEADADATEALTRDPTSAEAWRRRGALRTSWARACAARGEDATGRYARAIDDISASLARDAESAEAWQGRGVARTQLGQHLRARGEDPRAVLGDALADYAEAARRNPRDHTSWRGRAVVQSILAEHEAQQGGDPEALFAASVEAFGEAIARNATHAENHLMRGGTRVNWGHARAARGQDPEPLYADALADFDQTLALHPGHAIALLFRGNAHDGRARWRTQRGESAADGWRAALADWAAAIAANPGLEQGIRPSMDNARRMLAAAGGE